MRALIKENSEQTKKLCKVEDEGELRIDELEVFKTCFWNEPIPSRKLNHLVEKKLNQRLKSKERTNTVEKNRFASC